MDGPLAVVVATAGINPPRTDLVGTQLRGFIRSKLGQPFDESSARRNPPTDI